VASCGVKIEKKTYFLHIYRADSPGQTLVQFSNKLRDGSSNVGKLLGVKAGQPQMTFKLCETV